MGIKGFEETQVAIALDALLQYHDKTEKNELLKEGHSIDLQVGMKKVPDMNKKIRISLPHSLFTSEDELCLFVKDVDMKDHEETKSHFEDALRAKGVKNVAEVIPLRQIKTEYKEFEAKRNLSNLYSGFLADARIIRLLPGFLGKAFYRRNRMPEQVNVEAKDLKEQIHKVLHRACCHIKGRGPSCQVKVGSTTLSRSENVANINAAIQKLVEDIPGGAGNIKSLYLRSPGSPALPIFVTFESADDVVFPLSERKKDKVKAEDVTPVEGAKVIPKGNADFKVVKTRKSKAKKSKKITATNSEEIDRPKKLKLKKPTSTLKPKKIAVKKTEESDSPKQRKTTKKPASTVQSEASTPATVRKGKRKLSESETEKTPGKSPSAAMKKAKRKMAESETEKTPGKSPTAATKKAKREMAESESEKTPGKSPTAVTKKAKRKVAESETEKTPGKSPTAARRKAKRKMSESETEQTPGKSPTAATRKGKRKVSESETENTPQKRVKASRK